MNPLLVPWFQIGAKVIASRPKLLRLNRALCERPYNGTDERKRAAERLLRLGVEFVSVPGAGWVSVKHLARAGWCP